MSAKIRRRVMIATEDGIGTRRRGVGGAWTFGKRAAGLTEIEREDLGGAADVLEDCERVGDAEPELRASAARVITRVITALSGMQAAADSRPVRTWALDNAEIVRNDPSMRHTKKNPSKLEQLAELLPRDWTVETWSPGDGQTRYRFFHKAPAKQTYHGPANGQYTALGFKEAHAYAAGLRR